MNNILKWLYSILMIVLVTVLIWIFVSYYNSPVEVVPNDNITYMTPVITKPIEGNELIVSTEEPKNDNEQIPTTDKVVNPVIVSSENKTSDAEKQQVLSEIDETLNELFKIVDRVPTVDESKLGVDEGEVQQ